MNEYRPDENNGPDDDTPETWLPPIGDIARMDACEAGLPEYSRRMLAERPDIRERILDRLSGERPHHPEFSDWLSPEGQALTAVGREALNALATDVAFDEILRSGLDGDQSSDPV